MALNPEQVAAVTLDAHHCLVLAGAGTGKTRTLVARAAALIGSGAPPERLLVLAFTRRAARELRDRLEAWLGEAAAGIAAGTFHHHALLLMRRQPAAWGVAGMRVLDRDDAEELWRLARAGDVRTGDRAFPKATEIASWYSYARNRGQPFEAYLDRHLDGEDAETHRRVLRVAVAYERRKGQRGYLDFDDLLVRFADGLESRRLLRSVVAARYDEVLVDEAQDLNPVQWRILEALATWLPTHEPRPSAAPAGRDDPPPGTAAALGVRAMLAALGSTAPAARAPRLFCVGDDAQSIYAFRGADFEGIHDLSRRLPGARVITLTRNYRSHQEILDLANWLLDRSPLAYRKRLVAERGPSGERPVLLTFGSPAAEGTWVARDLVRRHGEHGASWRDHMVLLRTAYAGRDIEAALIAARVPYLLIGGASLMQAAHVRDLFALLRAALDAGDELAWSRYLRLWPRIGETLAGRAIEAMDGHGAFERAIEAGRAAVGRAEPFASVIEVRRHRDDPAAAVAEAVQVLTPILCERYDRWPQRSADLELLARLAERHRSLEAFLDTYALDPVVAERVEAGDEDDRVTLITVHSSKGSEAKVVYVAAATPRNYPHVRSRGDEAAVEEERRVMYVALTRARDELVITRSTDADPAWVASADASYFLSALPRGLVTEVELVHPSLAEGLSLDGPRTGGIGRWAPAGRR